MFFRAFRFVFSSPSIRTALRSSPFLALVSTHPHSTIADRLHDLQPPEAAKVYATLLKYPPTPYFDSLYPPFDMPAPYQQPPGRPNNLTPEQEIKLKELWIQIMKVFGVSAPPDVVQTSVLTSTVSIKSSNGVPVSSTASTLSSTATKEEPKKKKRFGILHRKDKDKENKKEDPEPALNRTASSLSSPTIEPTETIEDKYGQSKQYLTAMSEMTPEEMRIAFWSMVKADHPDGLLLRFLRARKWDVERALVMVISTMHWRLKDFDVEKIVFKGEGAALAEHDEGFMKQIRLGKSYLNERDKVGRPICVVRARLHKQGDQSEDALNRYTIYTIETARMCLKDPVDTATVVFDLQDFSLANMDYAPVKFMIKCFEAHYPESLGVAIVYKAPWIFQGIWNIVRRWLDPVVAAKIHFARSLDDLSNFIDREKIWKELGGPVDWEYKYLEPIPEEDKLLQDTETREMLLEQRAKLVREYEDATWNWIYSSAEESRTARNDIAKKLRMDYINLDPYLRARTVYDRMKYINFEA
ncbi:CRAL-TRIO domain-containing protein [Lipomyces oligophaga]|uniref:CRAL-TRIO domain-containing protein n=1 Tax=Lipomyces oligophaga TaxID=45792 RepID=UPI0034CFDEC1